jgi:hypothetical protein
MPTVLRSPRRLRLRQGVRRFSQALVMYGVVGIAISIIGLGLLLWTGARFGTFGDRVGLEVTELTSTVERTAQALEDASDSATSFSATIERTPPTIRQAAQTIRNLTPRLLALQAQATALDILGSRPLQGIGDLFGQMATDLDGLDTRLDEIAADLGSNRDALAANAESLGALADGLDRLAGRLEDGLVAESLADAQSILTLVLAMLVAWTAVPAAGALAFGLWLRRELRLEEPRPPVVVAEI